MADTKYLDVYGGKGRISTGVVRHSYDATANGDNKTQAQVKVLSFWNDGSIELATNSSVAMIDCFCSDGVIVMVVSKDSSGTIRVASYGETDYA